MPFLQSEVARGAGILRLKGKGAGQAEGQGLGLEDGAAFVDGGLVGGPGVIEGGKAFHAEGHGPPYGGDLANDAGPVVSGFAAGNGHEIDDFGHAAGGEET